MLLKPVDCNDRGFNVLGATELIDEQGQCLAHIFKHGIVTVAITTSIACQVQESWSCIVLVQKISSKMYIQKLHRQQCLNNYQFMSVITED